MTKSDLLTSVGARGPIECGRTWVHCSKSVVFKNDPVNTHAGGLATCIYPISALYNFFKTQLTHAS